MKKTIIIILFIFIMLCGCSKEKQEEITSTTESTIIKNAEKAKEYIKQEDYKSLAYAYIYNLKDGINSYESNTTGKVSAKVLFIDYLIDYNSKTIKKGNTYFVKDHSTSALMDVDNEFYMVDKTKILYSKDLKKYDVYDMNFHAISYSPDQYTIMGYVFNDESILSAELISNEEDNISIKYVLDNDLATNLVKKDMKNSGGLSEYPVFYIIEFTITFTNDIIPISYAIHTEYDAAKKILGKSRATQDSNCVISKINEEVIIENEDYYAELLG